MQTGNATDKPKFLELVDEIKSLLLGSWRFRWLAISLAWIFCVVSWLVIFNMTDIYKASTRLYIDTEASLKPLLQGLAIHPELLDEVTVMVRSITSRPSLEKIATRSGLATQDQSATKKAKLLNRLRENITIKFNSRRNQILEISFEDANPDLAKSIVTNAVDLFIVGVQGTDWSDTQAAQSFIEMKVKEYEQLLTEAELRLADFKKRNIGQMPGEQGGYYQRLASESAKLAKLESDLKLAAQKRDVLQSQIAGEMPILQNATIDSQQVKKLEAELIELRLRYTDSHPDIVRIEAVLESLRAGLVKQQPNTISPDIALDMNPVYQELKIQLGQVELEIARLSTEREDQKQLVDTLSEKIDVLPEIEAELTRLNRTYNTNKVQYDTLLTRLETARLSEAAEKSAPSITFHVIDPPTVSSSPVRPNRVLLATLAFFLAIACGVAPAIFRSSAEPVFYSSSKLERQYGVPVLGAITWRRSPAEIVQAWKNGGVFSICVLGLFVSFLVLIIDESEVLIWGPPLFHELMDEWMTG